MMTSSTSTTSTSGVTLMPEIDRTRPRPVDIVPAILGLHLGDAAEVLTGAIDRRIGGLWCRLPLAAHRGQDHVPQGGGLLLDVAPLLLEDVVVDDRRQRDQDADRGGDERLGDAAHDVPHRAHGVAPQLAEGGHDAEDRAEEADERRVVAERSEKEEARLERLAPQRGGLGKDLLD